MPDDRAIDGVDLHALHRGQARRARRTTRCSGAAAPYRVVRDGDWKLQMLDLPRKALLYDMKADPTERRDVAALHPDVVARLQGLDRAA